MFAQSYETPQIIESDGPPAEATGIIEVNIAVEIKAASNRFRMTAFSFEVT